MKTNCTKKEFGVCVGVKGAVVGGGGILHWALMKLKSWNSLSLSLFLHAKVASNRCVHVTVTIIISLRSCYNWQQFCHCCEESSMATRDVCVCVGGGWQDIGRNGFNCNACLNLGHLPILMGLSDRATHPHIWRLECCPVYSPELIDLIMFCFVFCLPPQKRN